MAKLSDLIDCLTNVLGLPRTTIEAYVKPLRKAGFISSTGRSGPGAPDMSAGDCTALLCALLGGTPTRAVETVDTLRALTVVTYHLENLDGYEFTFADVLGSSENAKNLTVFSAIEWLIRLHSNEFPAILPFLIAWSKRDENIAKHLNPIISDDPERGPGITLRMPDPQMTTLEIDVKYSPNKIMGFISASIRFDNGDDEARAACFSVYTTPDARDMTPRQIGDQYKAKGGDFIATHMFTEKTIQALGRLLKI